MPRRFWFCKKCQSVDFVTQDESDIEETLMLKIKEAHSTKNQLCDGDTVVLERWVVQAIARDMLHELKSRLLAGGCIEKEG